MTMVCGHMRSWGVKNFSSCDMYMMPAATSSVAKLSDQITQQPLQELRFIVSNDGRCQGRICGLAHAAPL
jgi:hypothetical protein